MSTSPVVRRGIAAVLAGAGWDAIEDIALGTPVVAVCELPGSATVDDVVRARESIGGAPLLIMTGHVTPGFLAESLASGASGVIERDAEEALLVQAVRAVADGRVMINSGPASQDGLARAPELTRRETQVLELLCAGRTNHEIAEALVISENTVKNHVRRLYEKMQVRSRTEAVVRAARWGLVRMN